MERQVRPRLVKPFCQQVLTARSSDKEPAGVSHQGQRQLPHESDFMRSARQLPPIFIFWFKCWILLNIILLRQGSALVRGKLIPMGHWKESLRNPFP